MAGPGGWAARLLQTLHRLQVGRLADAALAGALVALLLTQVLAGLKLDVVGALASLCIVAVLFLLAGYDLVVRWSSVDLQRPGGSVGIQRGVRRLLGTLWPEIVFVVGIVTGHLLWTG